MYSANFINNVLMCAIIVYFTGLEFHSSEENFLSDFKFECIKSSEHIFYKRHRVKLFSFLCRMCVNMLYTQYDMLVHKNKKGKFLIERGINLCRKTQTTIYFCSDPSSPITCMINFIRICTCRVEIIRHHWWTMRT